MSPITEKTHAPTLAPAAQVGEKDVAAVIDADEFQRASEDPRVRAFVEAAEGYVDEVEREGRNR